MEEEREPSPLILLGGDEWLREARAVGLATLRLRQQPGVLSRARREVGEHRRADDIAAVERAIARQPERRDLLAVDAQRKEHGALGRRGLRLLARREHLRPCPEDALGLPARLLEDLRRLARLSDRPQRFDQRREEGCP